MLIPLKRIESETQINHVLYQWLTKRFTPSKQIKARQSVIERTTQTPRRRRNQLQDTCNVN